MKLFRFRVFVSESGQDHQEARGRIVLTEALLNDKATGAIILVSEVILAQYYSSNQVMRSFTRSTLRSTLAGVQLFMLQH